MGTARLLGIGPDGGLHGEGRIAGPDGMVFMRERGAEQRHDAIAHDLVHRALVPMHGRHHPFQHRIEELPGLFRITVGQQFHRALEVRKEHGDLLAFAFQGAAGGENLLGQIGWGVGEGSRRGRWCHGWSSGRGSLTNPDQHGAVLIGREPLALDELVCERFQVLGIQLKLQLERPIRQAAPLAQQGDRLIHHGDKVHPVPSLPGAQPLCTCTHAS